MRLFLLIFLISFSTFSKVKEVKVFLPANKYVLKLSEKKIEFKSNNLYLSVNKKKCISSEFRKYHTLVNDISNNIETTFSGATPKKGEQTFLYILGNKKLFIPKNSIATINLIKQLEYEAHKLMNIQHLKCKN